MFIKSLTRGPLTAKSSGEEECKDGEIFTWESKSNAKVRLFYFISTSNKIKEKSIKATE